MARFRCRTCGEEGTFVYDGRHECPNCSSVDVQFARHRGIAGRSSAYRGDEASGRRRWEERWLTSGKSPIARRSSPSRSCWRSAAIVR
jgi:hypothetical protein